MLIDLPDLIQTNVLVDQLVLRITLLVKRWPLAAMGHLTVLSSQVLHRVAMTRSLHAGGVWLGLPTGVKLVCAPAEALTTSHGPRHIRTAVKVD